MNYIDNLINTHGELSPIKGDIENALSLILDTYESGGKILLFGNGGSCADTEHISGELLKGFMEPRTPKGEELEALSAALSPEEAKKLQRGIPAIPLTSLTASLSAFANDVSPELVFAQLVYALGKAGDLAICLSTSGNSKNVVCGAKVAKARGIKTLALTGMSGGALSEICDVTVKAPEAETYKVQEYHLPIYHALCAEAERILFTDKS
jgi:D-sedoheptulose 7-phosphate isomerase